MGIANLWKPLRSKSRQRNEEIRKTARLHMAMLLVRTQKTQRTWVTTSVCTG